MMGRTTFVLADENGVEIATVEADYNTPPAGNLVTITNREGNDGTHTAIIDNLRSRPPTR